MTDFISIEWTHGRPPIDPEEDEDRAVCSAEKILNDAGVRYFDAYEEYQRQLDEFDDEAPMTGTARIWIDARNAADAALTEGWFNPNGAGCSISAWRK